jgi:hypothetical protein
MIKTIVIAAQSQDRSAKVGSSRKIRNVTKKMVRAQFLKKSLFLLRELSKYNLETSLRRKKHLKKIKFVTFFL